MKRSIQRSLVMKFATLFLAACAFAQVPKANLYESPLHSLNTSLEQVTDKLSPAVVYIEVASYGPLEDEDDDVKIQTLTKQHGSGSGLIVDADGYIVTAYHLVEGARRIRVELDARTHFTIPTGRMGGERERSFEAKMVGFFKDADIAVLKIEAQELPTAPFADSGNLRQGQVVVSLGSPEGLRNSLALGIVGSASRQVEPDDSMEYIQTDAAMAPGSSGGPLVNVHGEVVGIDLFSITERGKEVGLGFAIPSATVRFVYEQIRHNGSVRRAYLDADVQGITPTLASALQLPADSGVVVAGVAVRTLHEKAALQAGDVLVSIDGKEIRNISQLTWTLLHKNPGDNASVEIWRASSKLVLELQLVGPPSDVSDSLATIDLEKNLVAKLGIVGSTRKQEPGGSSPGISVLRRVHGNGSQPELAPGDFIRSVNAVPVTSITQLRTLIDNFKLGDAVALQVERKGKLMYLAFEMD